MKFYMNCNDSEDNQIFSILNPYVFLCRLVLLDMMVSYALSSRDILHLLNLERFLQPTFTFLLLL